MELRNGLDLGGVHAEVVRKDIKHVHLSVYPPEGRVKVSAPLNMALDTIRLYTLSKLGWIKVQQRKIRAQERETPREYLPKESHYVWGRRYLMRIVEADSAPAVRLLPSRLELQVRPGSDQVRRAAILDAWYRQQIRLALPALLHEWQPLIGATPRRILVQRMKTRWGTCNAASGSIRLNTDLARKPPTCLEYILVHELVHLIEPTHNARFQALMERFMPHWRQIRSELNRLPVRHEDWEY